jgi:hypothetical protein
MQIGSEIQWRGRTYLLVGVDPMNVPERRAYLREPGGARVVEVPFEEIEPLPEPPADSGFGSEG